jgi:hypothetical protein
MTSGMEPYDDAASGACPAADGHCARRPRRRAPGRLSALAAAVVLAALSATWFPGTSAQEQPAAAPAGLPDEYSVKAAFLYAFGRFVEWPAGALGNAADPFVIGIVGEDSFGDVLKEIAAKKTLQDRRIVVRRFAMPDDYRPTCQILFVSRSLSAEQQAAMLKKTQGNPVLVVGETPGFAEKGGIINFYAEEDRIRFEINAEAARKAQLRLSAQLLSLGRPAAAAQPTSSN